MRSISLASVFLAACAFTPGSEPPGGGDPPPAGTGSGPAALACHTSLPELRLCLDFEDASLHPKVQDLSGLHLDGDATPDVAPTPRVARTGSEGAARLASSSTISVPMSPQLNISPQLTIEMWISPAAIVQSQQPVWVVGSPLQYGLGVHNGHLACAVVAPNGPAVVVESPAALPIGPWTHVACVYDATAPGPTKLRVFVAGGVAKCGDGPPAISTSVDRGVQIGDGFVGGIDDVHVHATNLSADICQLATGGTACPTACP